MSKYSEFISNIGAIDYKKYSRVSSREKLVAYTIKYLTENKIPTSFIYICVSAFKLFPDKFYFSEEFPEYPHIEMLNRTILHLRPKENNYATGSVGSEYFLTPIGEEVANQVSYDLEVKNDSREVVSKKIMDSKKKAIYNDLKFVKDSREFKSFQKNGILTEEAVWSFFNITPYTQAEYTRKFAKNVKAYAGTVSEKEVVTFLTEVIKIIS